MIAQRFARSSRRDDTNMFSASCDRDGLSLMAVQAVDALRRKRLLDTGSQRRIEVAKDGRLWWLFVNVDDPFLIVGVVTNVA